MSADTFPQFRADGLYEVIVTCPHCGVTDTVMVGVASQITSTKGESKLGAKFSQKKLDHKCGQTSLLTIVAETGETLRLDV